MKRAMNLGLKSSLNTVKARQVSVTAYQTFSTRCWKRGRKVGVQIILTSTLLVRPGNSVSCLVLLEINF